MPDLLELDRLADGAPAGGAPFADRTLAAAHRRRRTRLATVATAVAVLLVISVPAALMEATRPGRPHPQPGHVSTRPADRVADDVMIIAAGVRYMVGTEAGRSGVVSIYTRTCGPGLMLDPCRPQLVQRQGPISNVLADRSFGLPVRARWVTGGSELVQYHGLVVTLGNVSMTGSTARLPITAVCGLLCGRGMTLALRRQDDGVWVVTGTVGREWIS